ncbi:hypothetical protein O6H91_04G106600 [Diphasiastrum complanatum]|uniref:Uncharacterized protein n=1 Tax=Diphasiastrum complanatum TaxID=34168 RepID=A0ACC2E0J3_DIPCM|nr:hypothetical protein O6H91_04G106600 [Diphasiastrum complanatum]
MGLLQIMGNKVGHLLSQSSEAATPGSRLHWHSNRTDQSQSYEEDNVGLEREQQQNHYQRAVSENDSRDEFRGPDTTSLSAFLYSFFSSSEAEGHGADDQLFRQRLDEDSRSRFSSGQLRLAASASNQILQKETLDDIVRKKGISSGFEDEDLEEADWHLVSKHEVGNQLRTDSQAQTQKPLNVCILKLPSMSETSSLLSEPLRQSLLSALPTLARGRQWTLIYSTQRHGISLLTLYRRSSILPGPCLLVTGDTKGAVFGGLLSAPLMPTPKKKYQGTSETFVFTDVSGQPELYHPTGSKQTFPESFGRNWHPHFTGTMLAASS